MIPPTHPERYKHHRFPGDIISHGVWLYHRFHLSYRDVEELLFERGIDVTYEAIRQWCRKFGQDYANQLRRRRPRPGDKWYMDEVFLTINGERHYLWPAVDQDDHVLDILVQRRRNKKAAKKFFRKLLKGLQYMPRLERPSSRTWRRDVSLGAYTLTIATGHAIGALRFVAGPFARVACLVTTRARHWYETDTRRRVEVTAPDHVLVSGRLASGAAASVHVAAVPWARQRLPDGDLRAGRYAGHHQDRLVPARREAPPARRPGPP